MFAYEIKKGKLGRPLTKAAFTFRTQELWKNVVAIGGRSSGVTNAFGSGKGEPFQHTNASVTAVPARIANVDVLDLGRWI
jgi:predicted Zn-dependent protease